MSFNKNPRGIRVNMPSGYVIGRASRGSGRAELIRVAGLSGAGSGASAAANVDSVTGIVDVVAASGAFSAGEVLPGIATGKTITFLSGLADATGYAKVAPTADATFTFKKYPGATTVATVKFAAASNTPTFTAAADFSIGAGEAIYPIAPNPADLTLSDVVIAWKGTISG